MKILTTPEGAADGLQGYDFDRHYVTISDDDGGTMRIHYVEAGDPQGRPVVVLHGNPSWSYIWRHQIRAVADAGYRVIAPDLGGMGMSDKPAELSDYSVARHVAWMRSALIDELGLDDITFVLHDWGLIIGLRLVSELPDRFARIVCSNSGLPVRDPAEPLPEVIEASGPFVDFQNFVRDVAVWEPWTMLGMMIETGSTDELVAGYHAPYPEPELTIASRAFTQLLPTRPDNPMLTDNFEAFKVLDGFDRPFLTIYSEKDIVAPKGYQSLVERIPGAKGQPHVILEGGGHFLQEDVSDEYNRVLLAWLEATE
jgi:haloalkane dehalogenase